MATGESVLDLVTIVTGDEKGADLRRGPRVIVTETETVIVNEARGTKTSMDIVSEREAEVVINTILPKV